MYCHGVADNVDESNIDELMKQWRIQLIKTFGPVRKPPKSEEWKRQLVIAMEQCYKAKEKQKMHLNSLERAENQCTIDK